MFRSVDLAVVTARLRRAGHVPAVLLADLPVGLTGAPAAITGVSTADELDAVLAAALAGLASAPVAADGAAPGARGHVAASAARPVRADRPPPPSVSSAPKGRTLIDLPGRAAGRGTTVHGAVGGPSRLVHHGHDDAPDQQGVVARSADRRAGAVVEGSPAVTSAGRTALTPAPSRPPAPPRAGPLRIGRDEATAALLHALVAPASAARVAAPMAAGTSRPTPPMSAIGDGPPAVDRAAAPAGDVTVPGRAASVSTAGWTPTNTTAITDHPAAAPQRRATTGVGAPALPGGLAELVRWWEAAPAAGAAGALPSASPDAAFPVDGDDATVTGDPLSTFRDALELVLLDEALGDGLEVG